MLYILKIKKIRKIIDSIKHGKICEEIFNDLKSLLHKDRINIRLQ